MCEGQERGISGVIRHSPPSISFQYEGCFRRMRESNLPLSTGMALQVVR